MLRVIIIALMFERLNDARHALDARIVSNRESALPVAFPAEYEAETVFAWEVAIEKVRRGFADASQYRYLLPVGNTDDDITF